MKGKSRASKEVCITKDCVEEAAKNQLCKDVAIGDVIWVKLNGSSWWPAQVCESLQHIAIIIMYMLLVCVLSE